MSKNRFNDHDIVYFHDIEGNYSGVYEIRIINDNEVYLCINDFDEIIFSRENGYMVTIYFPNGDYENSYIEKNEELIEMSKLLDFILYESKYQCHSCENFEKYSYRILRVPDNCADFLCNDNACPNQKELLE